MPKTITEAALRLENIKNSRDYGAADGANHRISALNKLRLMAAAYEDDAIRNGTAHYWTDEEVIAYLRSFIRSFANRDKSGGE